MANRRLLKSGRLRVRRESGEEIMKFDTTKDPKDTVKNILKNVISQDDISTSKKLSFLNFFVRVLRKLNSTKEVLGYTECEVLSCLRIGLFHEAKEVRAATLRVLRHLTENPKYVDALFYFHLDLLVARSLDICLQNEIERIQALKLIRKIGHVAADRLPSTLLFPVIAIGSDGASEWDRLLRVCLATLCEIAFENIDAVYKCGGISTILRSILDCHLYPRLNESLTCTILYLLNHPRTRHYVRRNTDLEQLLAPFTDNHFRYSGETTENSNTDERENRFTASKIALITVMRSWPGLIRLCHPEGAAMQSLVGILYLQFADIRKSVIEMIFDLFRLVIPEWTGDFSVALSGVDPSTMDESWKLNEGFVAEEGRAILPHVAISRPNLVENHLALILCAWINAGILEALIEVITTSEGALFCRAVILLGELLHLANSLLPPDCSSHCHCLPNLVAMASSFDIPQEKRHQASVAISHLDVFHALKKRGAIPCSFFLDQLLQHSGKFMEYAGRHWHLRRDKLSEFYFKKISSEELAYQAVKDTRVLSANSFDSWDLNVIGAILKLPDEKLLKLDDQLYVRFVRQLVAFFKPSANLFSKLDITTESSHKFCEIGCHLIDFLLKSNQFEAKKQIDEWLRDISQSIADILLPYPQPHSAVGIQSLHYKLCQYYFVFIGKFTATQRGERYLDSSGLYQKLLELISTTNQDIYIKLTISSLNYSRDGTTRVLLSKALTGAIESARLYATKFLRVLLRIGVTGFDIWGLQMLVTQLYDPSQVVAMSALHILDETCDIPANLDSLINMRPSFLHLGQTGNMMLCKFVQSPKGFKSLMDANFLLNELMRWEKTFNQKYVQYVEELLNEALTTYEKTYHGSFMRRSILKRPKKEVFLPTHIYGQLVQHEAGLELLQKQGCIQDYFNSIQCLDLLTDEDTLKLKISLWAVGNIGMSALGIKWLEKVNTIPEIIKLAEESGVFSIRGTAFYVLGLVASTIEGSKILATFGWESQCYSREDPWPVFIERIAEVQEGDTPSFVNELDMRRSNSDVFTEDNVKTDANRNKLSPIPRSNTLSYDIKAPYKSNILLLEKENSLIPFRLRTFSAEKIKFFTKGNPELEQCLIGRVSETGPNITVSIPMKEHLLDSSGDKANLIQSEGSPSPENIDGVTIFQLGSRNLLRENRSNSDASNKSTTRTNSFNTDSTTSGVGSCESGTLSTTGLTMMNPIPSSFPTITSNQSTMCEADLKEPVHPSLVQRRLAKLNRVPSLHRRSASPAFPISSYAASATYTSYHDGYAALRTIKRTHTYSCVGDDGKNMPSFYRNFKRTFSRNLSIDSDSSNDATTISDFAAKRNVSTASLPDYDAQYSHINTAVNKSSIKLTATDHFVGLALPVDINMIFEVIEGEDMRSQSNMSTLPLLLTPEETSSLHLPGLNRFLPEFIPPLKKDVSLEHKLSSCLICSQKSPSSNTKNIFHDMPLGNEGDNSDFEQKNVRVKVGLKTDSSKDNMEDSSNTPKTSSTTDSDSGITKMSGDTDANDRIMVRKEIIRLVISLSSSVGMKGSEQGLLILKQKFPKAFQDLCFYSEVGQILATYSFRLSARRFTQELFDELNVSPLLAEAQSLVGVSESTVMTTIPQGSVDDFTEFS